jgi:P pilus assembly chaperone PapD
MSRFAHRAARGQLRAAVGALLVLAGARASHAQGQIVVDELELRLDSRPGSPRTESFRVANVGTAPAQATITIADWDRSVSGENRYFQRGTLAASCGARLSAFPMVVQVAPKSSQDIRVTLDSADARAASCHSILFVEQTPTPTLGKGVALQYTVRFGVKVYVEPENTPAAGEIEDFQISRAATDGDTKPPLSASIRYRNTAGRQTATHGTIEIRRTDNSLVTTVPIDEFPVLPGAVRQLAVNVPPLAAGHYVLLALLDNGGTEIIAAQSELTIP